MYKALLKVNGLMCGSQLREIVISKSFSTTFEVLTDHLYKIEIANNKFYIVHMELMKSAFPREIPDQIRKVIDYDCGEDKSLVEPDFPDNRPLTEKNLTQTVNRDELLREHDETPLILVPLAIPFQPLQQERRYPSRNRVQHIPYQHTP